MLRYIDADKVMDEINRIGGHNLCEWETIGVKALIDRQTTADVVEAKHGEWIEDGYADIPCVCSNCGAEAQCVSSFSETFDYDWEENLQPTGYEETREYIKTPYCSNCGAKMDGERKEE